MVALEVKDKGICKTASPAKMDTIETKNTIIKCSFSLYYTCRKTYKNQVMLMHIISTIST